MNPDRIQFSVFSVAGTFVDKKLKFRTPVFLYLFCHPVDLYDLIYVFFIKKALPARYDTAVYQHITRTHYLFESAGSSYVFILRSF